MKIIPVDALWYKLECPVNVANAIAEKYLKFELPNSAFMPLVQAGITDGYVRFYKWKDGSLYIPRPLTQKMLDHMYQTGYLLKEPVRLPLHHAPIDKLELPKDLPFEPHDFQLQAVLDSLNNNNQINVMATGSGKSFSIYLLVRHMLEKNIKTLLIVPNISLLLQMQNDFASYGWKFKKGDIKLIGGDYKDKSIGEKLTISTWQSLVNYTSQLKDIGCVIEDECHRASSNSHINKILPFTGNAYYRFGFTGTLPQELCKKVGIYKNFGNPKTYITPRELIDRGLATDIEIHPVFLKYPQAEIGAIWRSGRSDYKREVDYFCNHKTRTKIITDLINTLSGNSLVLFDTLKQGDLLLEALQDNTHFKVHVITGAISGKKREEIIQSSEASENNLILGSSKIMSTGINMKSLKNVLFVSGGKSYISVNQSIGRVLRTHICKDKVYLYDFVDILKNGARENYMLKHYRERSKFYLEHGYTIIEKQIDVSL